MITNRDKIIFPKVKNVSMKLLADNIIPYIPGDVDNMEIWNNATKEIFNKVKEEFNKKRIPIPKIYINISQKPIIKNAKR